MATRSDFETSPSARSDRRYFTVEQANRALPYVSRIAEDICETYKEAVRLQESLERERDDEAANDQRRRYEECVERLNRCVGELREVGVELKDYELGLLDFPAWHEDREVLLCWKLGEPRVQAWHELNAGFAGRQDVSLLEDQPTDTGGDEDSDESAAQ
jgi:hypothetical protein